MLNEALNNFNKFFGINNTTTLPLVISLFVFALGWTLKGISNLFKESKRRKTIKHILRKNLHDLSINLSLEAKNSLKSSKTFASRTDANFEITKNNFSQLSVFKEIGYQEMFNTFYKGFYNRFNSLLRIRAASRLWGVINSISDWEEYIKEEIKKFNELNNSYISLFNKSHKTYLDHIYNLIIHGNSFKTDNEKIYVSKLEQIRANWQKSDNFIHPDVVYEKLVLPSADLNNQYINITNHLILPSMSLLNDIDLSYRNRNRLLNSYSDLFITSNKFYLKNSRRIRIITSILYPSFKLSLKRFFSYSKKSK